MDIIQGKEEMDGCLGDFFTKEWEDGELELKVFDSTSHWKAGFTVEGIEIRPKEGCLLSLHC